MSAHLVKTINELRELLKSRRTGKIGLVPTMGALHKGHASLIARSVKECDTTVVSVFVNPVQFGVNEDYDKYPSTLEADLSLCSKLKADFVFAPSVAEMYGENVKQGLHDDLLTTVCPPFRMVDRLCGKSRPGHFDGVATVVTKLFNIVSPDLAFFGQKDAQQVIVLKKVAKDLNIPVKIVTCPLIRDDDGLATSSRNTYLSASDREHALSISKMLFAIKKAFDAGVVDTEILFETGLSVLDKNAGLEYLEFVDGETLEPSKTAKKGDLVATAVKIGSVRLIDNIIL